MHLEMENPYSRAVHRPGNNNIEMKCMVYPMAKWTGNKFKGLTSFLSGTVIMCLSED